MEHGKLIVIEGGDAAGKATQIALLTARLITENVPVTQLDFPQYERNHVGRLLRECLDGKHGDFMSLDPKIASVLFSVDRLESMHQLESWLEEGRVVLLDRYSSANVLHQGAKVADQHERLEAMRWIYKLEHAVLDLPEPDLIVSLPVPAAIRADLRQQQNRTKGRLIDIADQDQVHQQLVDTALTELSDVFPNVATITTMDEDTLLPPETIAEKVYTAVRDVLNK